jgi:adenylate cyclase
MSEETTSHIAILFADVSGSTQLYDTVGDSRARAIIARYMDILKEVTVREGGTIVKTIGDEVMCTFPTAHMAAHAATVMQETITNLGSVDGKKLTIRIGFHAGPVIHENNDVFGDAVNVAARMAGQAKPAQIITSGESVSELNSPFREKARFLIETTVKGKKQPVRIFEITWEKEEMLTVVAMPVMGRGEGGSEEIACYLEYEDQQYSVTEIHESMTLGRGLQNTFIVPHVKASRLHATIEFRRGKFILTDRSTNGTYVRTGEGELIIAHREETILRGAGVIGLGQDFTLDSPAAVHFKVDD